MDFNGTGVELTEAGFLVNPDDWSEGLALALAQSHSIQLSDEHWEIIHFIRRYYQKYNHLPNTRMFVKAIRTTLGEEKGNSRYLHGLFPDGPLKFSCKLGGLPKPPNCI